MSVSFLQRYNDSKTWQEKVLVMNIYYLAVKEHPAFKLDYVAKYFGVSVSLVSENLKLAKAIHDKSGFIEIKSRNEALKQLMKG